MMHELDPDAHKLKCFESSPWTSQGNAESDLMRNNAAKNQNKEEEENIEIETSWVAASHQHDCVSYMYISRQESSSSPPIDSVVSYSIQQTHPYFLSQGRTGGQHVQCVQTPP